MLRQVSLVTLLIFLLSALVLLDFKAAERAALGEHRKPPGFLVHLLGLPTRLGALVGLGGGNADPSGALARMLPVAPEGWTVREVEEGDAKSLLAKSQKDNDPATVALIEEILSPRGPKGTRVAHQLYARKDRLVVVKLVRAPDALFTEPENLDLLDTLWAPGPELVDFLRLRGLDVGEVSLPEKVRARVFTAEIGGQLRLWVLASARLEDADLVPFFERLDVKAMNAAVLDGDAGLGDLPVLLLVSDLSEEARAEYEADRAKRARDRENQKAERRAALVAGEAVEAASDSDGCREGDSGFTICVSGG